MDIQAKIKNIEQTLNRTNAQIEVKKDMLVLSECDCFVDNKAHVKELTFEGKQKSVAKVTLDFSLTLGSVKVYLNGIFLSRLKCGESTECLQIGIRKGDNKLTFDLSNAQDFFIKKLSVFGYVCEKDFGSKISSFLYGGGAFLSEYNGAKKIAELKYIEGENIENIKTFTDVKFFAMSPIDYTNKAVLIALSEDKLTAYLFDLIEKKVLFETDESVNLKYISASRNATFFAVENSGAVIKYIFDERLEYSTVFLDLFAKKVITSPQVSAYAVVNLTDKVTLYR